jgi:ABC-type nitrate/sulfonate/bicarbonate transport system substrate-binding protein
MRPIALRLAPILIALIVVSCGGTPPASVASPTVAPTAAATAAPTAAPTQAAPIKVRAAYQNITPANLAPYFAKEQGIFLKHGLDVDLPLIEGGAKVMAAILGNSVDIAQVGGTEIMNAYVGGGDVEAVALFVPVSPWVLMAPASYTGPNDLKGKTVGVASRGGSAEIAAVQCIDKLGLKPTDVTIVATGSTANLTAAMLANQVYAGPGHPPDTAALFKAGFKVIMDLAAQKVPAVENTTVTTKKFANANKDVVQKYVDSLVDAIAVMKKDKPTTLTVMKKLLKLTDDAAASQTYDFYVTGIFPTYPEVTPPAWIYSRDELAKTTPTVKDLDVTKVIDNSFVADAQKRKVGG